MTRPLPLSRERVVAAALSLIEREGSASLSMRRLADEMGTAPASLYRHIANRDELVALVVERILDDVAATFEVDADAPWQERARAWAHTIRNGLRRSRGKVALLVGPEAPAPDNFRLFHAATADLASAGFPPAVAVATVRTLTFTVFAFVDMESQWPDALEVEAGSLLADWQDATPAASIDETFEFLVLSVISMVERRLAAER